MPAAQPSKASISNVIVALLAAGLTPAAIRVQADGSFDVDLVGGSFAATADQGSRAAGNDGEPPRWGDGL